MTDTTIPIPRSTTHDHVEDGTYLLATEGNSDILVSVRGGEVFDGPAWANAGALTASMFKPVFMRPRRDDEVVPA